MSPLDRLVAVAVIVAAVASSPACSLLADAGEEAAVRIAFFQDLSVPDHVDLVSPSFLALDMVLERRLAERGTEAEVVQFDTGGDTAQAIEMAEAVAADQAFVLAVAAPFWHEPAEVSDILAAAGVPTISLSPVSASPWASDAPPDGESAELWRRFVPDRAAEARLLSAIAARRSPDGVAQPVCLVRDATPYGQGLADEIAAGLEGWPASSIDGADPEAAAATIASAGCRVVVWAGFSPGARELARAMRSAGSARGRPVDLAGDAMKTTIPPTSPAGDGVVVGSVSCPCADVATALALASRRFVNAYQSEHGLTPGVYAAEAWDAGRLVADAVAGGAGDRTAMRSAIAGLVEHDGVARTYRFDDLGELVGADAGLFVAAGTRWLPVPA